MEYCTAIKVMNHSYDIHYHMNESHKDSEWEETTVEEYTHYDVTCIRFKTAKFICCGQSQDSGHVWGRRSDSKSTRGKFSYGLIS